MLKISVVVCTYQRPNEIQRLLETLANQIAIPDEIIIVDGSLDAKTEMVTEEVAGIFSGRLIYLRVDETERGLTRQRNIGIARAKGEIIAFLDDDTIPDECYFQEILSCFQRHPEAVGVGGLITTGIEWKPRIGSKPKLSRFYSGTWERRDALRWRLRKILGLDSPLLPGWMPPFGHGRPGGYPPDGNDYQVELVMGGASAWRCAVFNNCRFSTYFEGYGLYEDSDFCIRASKEGSVYLCTRAQLEHYHATDGRPNQFKYGKMVVRNGWFVWRRRWPNPSAKDKIKWWVIMLLLASLRLIDFRNSGTQEAFGRFWGMLTLFWNKPMEDAGNEKRG